MRRLFTLIVALLASVGHAQEVADPRIDISRMAEDLVGTPDDDEQFEASYEQLLQTISRPVNLNHGNLDVLVSLGMLTNLQARNIVEYRSRNGAFLSFYELQAVPDLPLEVIDRLRPLVTVLNQSDAIDRTLIRRIIHESNSYLLMRLSRAWDDGDKHQPYIGSPAHVLMRYRLQRPGDFSFGFNTEKDAGEPVQWDAQHRYYGFDRWTFHAQLQRKGIVRNLVVGDFQAQFGQGLMLGGAFGPGKGSETITTMRRANVGIVPYTSAYESGNLRGIGVTLGLSRSLELSILGSRARRDASLELFDNGTVAKTIQRSGLHRTETELSGKQKMTDTQLGGVLQYKKGPLEIGLMMAHNVYGYPVAPELTPYNQFAFSGKTLSQGGIFYAYNTGRFAAFGEYVKELGGGSGLVTGILGSVTRRLDVAVLFRRYAADFHPRFSNAISENSAAANEQGIYVGWRYQFNRKVTLTAYIDLFSFPWLRYRAYAPSFGYEWLGRLSYQPSRNVLLFVQAREECKERNGAADATGYAQVQGIKDNYWVHAEIGLRDHLRLRTRLQMSRFAEDGVASQGMAVSQDVRFGWKRYELVARYALFDTDNYDNRLYSYENDVLFAYSMPAYNGTGIRKMVMARVNITRRITIWARYAETTNMLPEDLSPGQNVHHYSMDREVRFQLRIQF